MKYKVLRPPLHKDYELPTRNELLKLKPGDLVKVTFQVADDAPERMWVELTECSDSERWAGRLDNDPAQPATAAALKADMIVVFHPLDIIATE